MVRGGFLAMGILRLRAWAREDYRRDQVYAASAAGCANEMLFAADVTCLSAPLIWIT